MIYVVDIYCFYIKLILIAIDQMISKRITIIFRKILSLLYLFIFVLTLQILLLYTSVVKRPANSVPNR